MSKFIIDRTLTMDQNGPDSYGKKGCKPPYNFSSGTSPHHSVESHNPETGKIGFKSSIKEKWT